MKTLVVLPAIARSTAGDACTAPSPTEPLAGAWVGLLLNGAPGADHIAVSAPDVETSAGTPALDHLQPGDTVFIGRGTSDCVGIITDRETTLPRYVGIHDTPYGLDSSARASSISRTLEFLRQ